MRIDKITEIMKNQEGFFGAVQVSQKQTIHYNQAWGYAKLFDAIPNNTNTSFGIASGTKGFTAIAVLQLVDQGKLSLDDDVFKIVPYEFPNVRETITVRHLLSHTSGIYDYFDEDVIEDFGELFKVVPISKILGPRDMVPMLITGECYFSPGTEFKYCNSGYVILGILIEVVSGISYSEYLEQNIIKPLGLKGTGCYKTNQLPKCTAVGYMKNENDQYQSNIFEIPMACTADGGLFTTVNDMNLLWNGFMEGKLVSDKIKDEALKKQAKIDDGYYYGLGFYIICDDNDEILFYGLVGSDPGVSFVSRYYTSDSKTMTIISNNEYDVWKIAREVAKHL